MPRSRRWGCQKDMAFSAPTNDGGVSATERCLWSAFSGIIASAYRAGQGSSGTNNTVDLKAGDGSIYMVGIYVNDARDVALFCPGHAAAITYALDELKPQAASTAVRLTLGWHWKWLSLPSPLDTRYGSFLPMVGRPTGARPIRKRSASNRRTFRRSNAEERVALLGLSRPGVSMLLSFVHRSS